MHRAGVSRTGLLAFLALAAAYCALAVLGLRWASISGAASPVFPAAGVALAGLVLGGRRMWGAVFLGALAATLIASAVPLWTAFAIAAGNTFAYAAGAEVLRRLRIDPALSRLRDVLLLVGAAVACAAVSAALGAAAIASGVAGWAQYEAVWVNWLAGDATGSLVVAPLILAWIGGGRRTHGRRWWAHLAGATAAAAVVALVVFRVLESPLVQAFFVFPPLAWAALACGLRGAAAAMLPWTVVAIWGTTMGHGPFALDAAAHGQAGMRFVLLQELIAISALTSLVLAVVADERRGERALRESEERYRLLFDSMAEGFVLCEMIYDAAGRAVDYRHLQVNPAFERLTGVPAAEAHGRRVLELLPGLDREWIDFYARVVGTGRSMRLERHVPQLDRIFDVHAFRPSTGRFGAVFTDVTERRRAEREIAALARRLTLLVDNTPLGVVEWDGDFVVRRWSGQAERLFGWTAAEVVGRRIDSFPFVPGEDEPRVREVMGRLLDPANDFVVGRNRNLTKSGEVRSCEWYNSVLHDDAGRMVAVLSIVLDVTEREERERALAAANRRLEETVALLDTFLASSPLGMTFLDAGFRYVRINETLAALNGIAASEHLGRTVEEVLPGVWPAVRPHLERVAATGAPVLDVEVRSVIPGRGEEGVWLASYYPVRLGDELLGYGIVAQDVTDGRRAAEALRRSEATLRSLLDNTPSMMGVVELPPDASDVLHVLDNAYAERFFGLGPGESAGKWARRDFGAAAETIDRWARAYREAKALGRPVRFGFAMDGRTPAAEPVTEPAEAAVWMDVSVSYMGAGADGRDRYCYTALDDTDRRRVEAALRESEERFRTVADATPALVWACRPDGYLFYMNPRWERLTGQPLEMAHGYGWADAVHPDEREALLAKWRHATGTGSAYEGECRYRDRDGRYRWHFFRALPLPDGSGAAVAWYGTSIDIEEQRRAESEREHLLEAERAARAEAERASRLKDEFLATVSHELRTPLNAILGWAQILTRTTPTGPTLQQALSVIERNAAAQAQLIEDLLDMSRIISGKLRLDVQPVDLHEVVAAAVETVRPSAEAKQIRLRHVLDPRVGPVRGDPNRLQQVVWNLLSNAVKFTPKGGRVDVALERVNSHVEVTVTDDGQGIEPEFLPHVFDRFRQADASTTRQHGGLGLGLAIVRHLVELHGGRIRVKSPGKGQGATFVVELPLAALHPPGDTGRVHPATRRDAGEARPDDGGPSLEGVVVLAVDDEPDSLSLIRRVLEDRGARVLTAGSAAEALEALAHETPHVLLSDVGMPGTDGYELMRRVRALGGEKAAVAAGAVTAFARSEDRTRAMLAGYHVHLSKPVAPAELVATVASLAKRTGGGRET